MPTLDDDLQSLDDSSQWRGRRCYTGQVLEQAAESTAELLRHLIDETPTSAAKISATLLKHGVDLPAQSIQRHRNRRTGRGQPCRCP